MKIFLAIILFSTGTISALSKERFDAQTWRTVQTYDVPTLEKMGDLQLGKIVGVRCNYRHSRVRHIKPNWYEGSIWSYRPGEENKFAYLRVMVSKADLPAFELMTTDFKSPRVITVYGQFMKEAEGNFLFLRLLGRKATIDRSGNALVDW